MKTLQFELPKKKVTIKASKLARKSIERTQSLRPQKSLTGKMIRPMLMADTKKSISEITPVSND